MFKINDTEVSKVQIYGGNIIKYPYSTLLEGNGWDNNGVNYKNGSDGVIHLNGTATSDSYLNLALTEPYPQGIPSGMYTLSGCPITDGVTLALTNRGTSATLTDGDNNPIVDSGNTFTGTISVESGSGIIPVVAIKIATGTVLNDVQIKPMFNIGSKALPFKTYFEKVVSKIIVKQGETKTTIYEKA